MFLSKLTLVHSAVSQYWQEEKIFLHFVQHKHRFLSLLIKNDYIS